LFFLFSLTIAAQTRKIDSLRTLSNKAVDDTNKILVLTNLSNKFNKIGLFDSAEKYAKAAILLAEKLNNKLGLAEGYKISSLYLSNTGNYPEALKYLNSAIKIYLPYGNKGDIAGCYNQMGNIFYRQGNYPEALDAHLRALKIRIDLRDSTTIAYSYVNIANIYGVQKKFPQALKNYLSSLKMLENSNDKVSIASINSNIGQIYLAMKKFSESEKYFITCSKIMNEIGDQLGLALSYISLGSNYRETGRYQEALDKDFAALKIANATGEKQYALIALYNIGMVNVSLKKYNDAIKFLTESYKLSEEIGDLETVKDAGIQLSDIYSITNKPVQALEFYKAHVAARDSIFNEENTKETTRLEMNYEFEKKEAASKLLQEKKDALTIAEDKKNKIIIYSISGMLLLVLGFAVFAYRSYMQKQKANIEISEQKAVIEEKQKEILDSIRYAKRIQTAHLPSEKYLDQSLKRLANK
jgi:tetratricopeptide (TPR) repeat protein